MKVHNYSTIYNKQIKGIINMTTNPIGSYIKQERKNRTDSGRVRHALRIKSAICERP